MREFDDSELIDEDPRPDGDRQMLYRALNNMSNASVAEDEEMAEELVIAAHDELVSYLNVDLTPDPVFVILCDGSDEPIGEGTMGAIRHLEGLARQLLIADEQLKGNANLVEWLLRLHDLIPGLDGRLQGCGLELWIGSNRANAKVLDWRTTTPKEAVHILRGPSAYMTAVAEGRHG